MFGAVFATYCKKQQKVSAKTDPLAFEGKREYNVNRINDDYNLIARTGNQEV